MHTKDALAAGETQERLNLIAVWRHTVVFTDAERAALIALIAVINSFNLFNVIVRRPAGEYRPRESGAPGVGIDNERGLR